MPIQVDIALDPLTGDIAHPTRIITGMELIQQRIRVRLRRGLGEYFLDPEGTGLPLLEWRQSKPPQAAAIASRIQEEIREIPGVTRTANFQGSHDPATRTLTVSGDVYADDGAATSLLVVGSTDPARNNMVFALFFSARTIQGGIPRPTSGRP